MKIMARKIEWDTDGRSNEECGLLTEWEVDIPDGAVLCYLHERVAIKLHDTFGFNPVRFEMVIGAEE